MVGLYLCAEAGDFGLGYIKTVQHPNPNRVLVFLGLMVGPNARVGQFFVCRFGHQQRVGGGEGGAGELWLHAELRAQSPYSLVGDVRH